MKLSQIFLRNFKRNFKKPKRSFSIKLSKNAFEFIFVLFGSTQNTYHLRVTLFSRLL
jgi:hypothetical protein